MSEELRQSSESASFDLEKAKATIETKFKTWKAAWVTPRTGPNKIRGVVRPFVSAASLAAEKPEEDAYADLINTCAELVALASSAGKDKEIIDSITEQGRFTAHSSIIADWQLEIANEIFKKTLELVKKPE